MFPWGYSGRPQGVRGGGMEKQGYLGSSGTGAGLLLPSITPCGCYMLISCAHVPLLIYTVGFLSGQPSASPPYLAWGGGMGSLHAAAAPAAIYILCTTAVSWKVGRGAGGHLHVKLVAQSMGGGTWAQERCTASGSGTEWQMVAATLPPTLLLHRYPCFSMPLALHLARHHQPALWMAGHKVYRWWQRPYVWVPHASGFASGWLSGPLIPCSMSFFFSH